MTKFSVNIYRLFLPVILYCYSVNGVDVIFPSGEVFTSEAETGNKEFEDVEMTATPLFMNDDPSRRLSLNIPVSLWAGDKPYFRANPVFLKCIQDAWTEVQNNDDNPLLISGYKVKSDVTGTTLQDNYSRSGTGIELSFKSNNLKSDMKPWVRALLKYCPVPFSEHGRDLGMITMKTSIFVFMTGTKSDSRQIFKAENSPEFNSDEDFQNYCQETLDEVFDKPENLTCNEVELNQGSTYPENEPIPDNVVGKIEIPVTRWMNELDFTRLIQYPANSMKFSSPEKGAQWCGHKDFPCVDCNSHIVGNSPKTRCKERLMSPRMFEKIRRLQWLTRNSAEAGNSKLKVLMVFDEPTNLDQEGKSSPNSLYREARQIKLTVDNKNFLKPISKLAICVSFDWVSHAGDYLELAVIKQEKLSTQETQFTSSTVMPVRPSQTSESDYLILEDDQALQDSFPLYDSLIGDRKLLAPDTTLSLFRSKDEDFRYMRVDPSLASCYSNLIFKENRAFEEEQDKLHFKIVRAFISTAEERSLFDPVLDERVGGHTFGRAIQLEFDQKASGQAFDPKKHTTWYLAEALASICGPIFFQNQKLMGIGFYEDGVYVDMRDKFKVWTYCGENCEESFRPKDKDLETYMDDLKVTYAMALKGRLVDPINLKTACELDHPPRPQSISYVHEHPEIVKRIRRSIEEGMNDENICVPQSNTEFCRRSTKSRQEAVQKLWGFIKRKHIVVGEKKLLDALNGCLNVCGTCTENSIWDSKVEHCSNLLHWMPFNTLNDVIPNAVTNLYSRGDEAARHAACYGSSNSHCVDKSPLFSILYPTLEAIFPWEEGKSVKSKIYDPSENPSPLLKEISRIYAANAVGTVSLWLRTEQDIGTIADALKVVFLYNKNVTDVKIHILDKLSQSAIISVLESYLEQWSQTGCPQNSRAYITPYTIEDARHHAVYKRSVDTECRDEIMAHLNRWETNGLFANLL